MIKIIQGWGWKYLTEQYNEFCSRKDIEIVDKKVEVLSHYTPEHDGYAENYNVEIIIILFYNLKENK